ncbi:hypothetical protein N7456_010435 [Penicillium angulare]|uniref:F-box domain-containing protein n=1 Tax=Penicillium angulare TaxID=116970 RepID=A0A9W9K669_9EURO|nr:hypothetical protein N7456_010435 [Penicillium angulare]
MSTNTTQQTMDPPNKPLDFDFFEELPLDIFLIILKYMDCASVFRLSRCSQKLYSILESERERHTQEGHLAPHWYYNQNDPLGNQVANPLYPPVRPGPSRKLVPNLYIEGHLVRTVIRGHVDALRRLLDLGGNPNTYSTVNRCLLSHAAAEGHTDVMRLLIERGAVLDRPWKKFLDSSPLKEALNYGGDQATMVLLKAGVSLGSLDDNAEKFVMNAGLDVIRYALKRGWTLPPGRSILHHILYRENRGLEDRAVLHLLLPLIVSGGLLNEVDIGDASALHYTRKGDREFVMSIIAAGIDLDIQDARGTTALHVALDNGDYELAREYIKAGCGFNRIDYGNQNELHVCLGALHQANRVRLEGHIISDECVSMASLLIEKGVNVDYHWHQPGDLTMESPMWYAIKSGNTNLVRSMLTLGPRRPDLTLKDRRGRTPVQYARELVQERTGEKHAAAMYIAAMLV